MPQPTAIRTPSALISANLAPESARQTLTQISQKYAIAIPPHIQNLITHPTDPIALQFIPHASELITAPHESADPIADQRLSPTPGITHRYPDRALLKPTLACPVYCRFCFRREQIGPTASLLTETELQAAYNYLASHPEIREVILTGGDPLILSPRRLSQILTHLQKIPHIQLLRIHTRAPIAEPSLITDELANTLDIQTPLFIALHTNHASELTPDVTTALQKLQRRGIPILGQSVLLANVNDTEDALESLFLTMLRNRIKPYYLHQLDPAPGTARFHVPPERGRALLATLRGRISGHALPTYIIDRPNGEGKIPL